MRLKNIQVDAQAHTLLGVIQAHSPLSTVFSELFAILFFRTPLQKAFEVNAEANK